MTVVNVQVNRKNPKKTKDLYTKKKRYLYKLEKFDKTEYVVETGKTTYHTRARK